MVDRHERTQQALGGAGDPAWRSTGAPGLVPGTGLTPDALERVQLRARREQAKVVRAALIGARSWLTAVVGRAAANIRRRRATRKAIRELNALDDRLLRDIGIGRSDIPAVAAGTADPRLGAPWVRYASDAEATTRAADEEPPRKAA